MTLFFNKIDEETSEIGYLLEGHLKYYSAKHSKILEMIKTIDYQEIVTNQIIETFDNEIKFNYSLIELKAIKNTIEDEKDIIIIDINERMRLYSYLNNEIKELAKYDLFTKSVLVSNNPTDPLKLRKKYLGLIESHNSVLENIEYNFYNICESKAKRDYVATKLLDIFFKFLKEEIIKHCLEEEIFTVIVDTPYNRKNSKKKYLIKENNKKINIKLDSRNKQDYIRTLMKIWSNYDDRI